MDLGVVFYHSVKDDFMGGFQADDNYFDTVQACIEHLKKQDVDYYLKFWKIFEIDAIKREDIGKDVVDVKVMLRLKFQRGKLVLA